MHEGTEESKGEKFIYCRNTYCTMQKVCRRGDDPPTDEPYWHSIWVGPKKDSYGRNLECVGYIRKDEAIN